MKNHPKHTPMLKISLIASACVYAATLHTAQAQTAPNAADVLRNIEQNKLDLNRTAPKPAAKKPIPAATTDQGFARLKEIQIKSPLFSSELMDFWTSEINKPVPAQKLSEFKAFAWELFQSKGYLAYITTSAQPTPEGSVLTVNVAMPTVGKVSVVTTDGKGNEFVDEVARRFSAIYKAGTPVDVQGFENQLSAASYDLPVDLDVSLRQVSSTVVDVVINLRPVSAQLGTVLGGLVQGNNYGLSQFGRNQVLGSVRVAGFTPLSELTLTTQQSHGVGYYRSDYDAPITGTGVRWKVYASHVKSSSTSTKGLSQEAGAGLTKLLSTDRVGRWFTGAEVSRRETQNWTTGDTQTADRVDQQLRLKLRAESSKGWADNFNNELLMTIGNVNLDRLTDDRTDDASKLKVAGNYQKLELSGGLSHVLDKSGIYTGSVRWKAQTASKNLDTYNKISLGGVNGIRAYSSIDGVGDKGALVSFDIVHQVVPDVYGGLFYDVGMVKTNMTPLSTSTGGNTYVLRGAGWQVGGKIAEFNWSLSMGYAMGQNPASFTSANTQRGDVRANFAVTRPF